MAKMHLMIFAKLNEKLRFNFGLWSLGLSEITVARASTREFYDL